MVVTTSMQRIRALAFGVVAAGGCSDTVAPSTPTISPTPSSPSGAETSRSGERGAERSGHELVWEPGPPLPEPRSNNAVVSVRVGEDWRLYSMLGLGSGRTAADIARDAWVMPRGGSWRPSEAVPGGEGRLAATAQATDGKVYLFGGYTVAPDGAEVSTAQVDVYDPISRGWSKAAPMPTPVDDAVSVSWRDTIVLVSGWHQRDNVRDVQRFDPATNRWSALPPIVGTPVFGHAGAMVRDSLVYCDGVGVDRSLDQPFFAVPECHAMALADADPRWTALPHHGRATRYRAAAGALPERGWVVFAGGTGRPYNYDGTGYDGLPAQARGEVFAWDVGAQRWLELPPLPTPSMDHRGLVRVDDALWSIGGMQDGGEVHGEVWVLRERGATSSHGGGVTGSSERPRETGAVESKP